jgi:hypothetical protein
VITLSITCSPTHTTIRAIISLKWTCSTVPGNWFLAESSLLIPDNEYTHGGLETYSPDLPANQIGSWSGGARDEPGVCGPSCGVSKSLDKESHATASIGEIPVEVAGCRSGNGPE